MDAYHAEKGVATKTGLDKIDKSPAKYHAWMTGEVDDKETPALKESNRLHVTTLEPDKFDMQYFDLAKPKFTGKGARSREAAWKAEHPEWDSEYNLGDKRDYYLRIRDRVLRHPVAKSILIPELGECEAEFRREIETLNGNKVQCKCRYDYISKERTADGIRTFGADLKFVREDGAMADKFWWHVRDYRYHVQEAFYSKVEPVEYWYFIVVEKTVPFDMAVYCLPKDLLYEGDRLVDENLQTFYDCHDRNVWPGYGLATPTELMDPRRR